MVAVVSLAATAQAAIIRGTVVDVESNAPLVYVSVLLNGTTAEGGVIRNGQPSDPRGGFRFTDLPKGTYKLRFLYIGYAEHEEEVLVELDSDVELEIKLKVKPIEVKAIVVGADRFRNEREVQPAFVSIDVDVLANVPGVVEADPIRSIQLLPGVQAASDISTGLYVRGGGPDQTLVLLDNVPVYNPTHALGFFSTFNGDALGDVTLYKGAYPAQYGGRLGAVLEVSSREPTTAGLHGRGGVSTIAARITAEGPVGNNRWMVSGRRTYLEPLLNKLRTEENPLPSYYFYDLNGKFLTERNRDWWVFGAYRGRDNIGFDLGADGNFDVVWGNTLLSASYNRLSGESFLAEAMVSGSEYTSDTDGEIFGTTFELVNTLRDVSFRSDLDWYGLETHRVRGGLQASVYDFTYRQTFNKNELIRYGTTPYELSIYADDQWVPLGGTVIRGGLRSRYLSEGDRCLFEPRISASYALPKNVRLKFGGGIYNQYLQLVSTEGISFGDFYVPIDETTRPGRSVQVMLGTEWEPSIQYQFSVEGYYTDLDNLVVLNNNVAGDQTSTATADIFHTGGTGYATGIELFGQRRTGNLTGWLGYTFGWTRRRFENINEGREYPPKYDRRHDVNVVANYKRGDWNFGAAFVYATGQAFTPVSARYGLRDPATGVVPDGGRVLAAEKNSARLLPYNRLDVSVARAFELFGYDAELTLEIFNLYSRRNEWFVQYGEDNDEVQVDVVKMLPIVPSLGVNFKF
jgi:hypothetical protein